LGGGKILDLHRFNYPWSEYTIGAFGNIVLLATGLFCAALHPARSARNSTITLWGWLANRKQTTGPHEIQLGETP
jgi:hypothetical protein